MLAPLKQWVCDRCSEVIQKPEDGFLEWLADGDAVSGFKIVHARGASSRGGECFHYTDHLNRADMHLSYYLGPAGLSALLGLLDPGAYHAPTPAAASATTTREFVETARRLHVPYFEEARRYWDRAEADGLFDGSNEDTLYAPEFLQSLVKRYAS